jgi:hypothetical protein
MHVGDGDATEQLGYRVAGFHHRETDIAHLHVLAVTAGLIGQRLSRTSGTVGPLTARVV